jgi:hypothetical protein
MKVVAHTGSTYLLETESGFGRIFDMERGVVFPETSLTVLWSHGWWREFEGDPEAVLTALDTAEQLADTERGQAPLEATDTAEVAF